MRPTPEACLALSPIPVFGRHFHKKREYIPIKKRENEHIPIRKKRIYTNTCLAEIFTRSENYQDEDTYQNYCQDKRSDTANNVLPCNTHACVSGRVLRVRSKKRGGRPQQKASAWLDSERERAARRDERKSATRGPYVFTSARACRCVRACIAHVCHRLQHAVIFHHVSLNRVRKQSNFSVIAWLYAD